MDRREHYILVQFIDDLRNFSTDDKNKSEDFNRGVKIGLKTAADILEEFLQTKYPTMEVPALLRTKQ